MLIERDIKLDNRRRNPLCCSEKSTATRQTPRASIPKMSSAAAEEAVSSDFLFVKKNVAVGDSFMAYIDVGPREGPVAVFLHGNPTSSYLWRNIIHLVQPNTRCVAPDLIGFGDSGKVPGLEYRFADHQQYLSAFLDNVLAKESIIFVLHDWGSALGFDWASRHSHRIAGLVFMEFIAPVDSWDDLHESASPQSISATRNGQEAHHR